MKKVITVITMGILIAIIALTFSFYACTSSKQKNTNNQTQNSTQNQNSNTDHQNENNSSNNSNNEFLDGIFSPEQNEEKENNNTQTQTGYIAPYVDMVAWVDPANEYSINGTTNLAKLAQETGQMVYSLGFIQLNQSTPTNPDGSPCWGWGGYFNLNEKQNDGFQYEGIKQSILGLKNMGGDVIVSFGGQLGQSPWTVCQDIETLKQMYYEVISAYNLSRIDLDIEESNQDANNNYINALALKEVQQNTGIKISLTIPILPSGWQQKQIDIILAYLGAGVEIDVINSMTMCYYNYGLYSDEDYADASIRALKNASVQLQNIYSKFGITTTKEECYSKLGATVAIGTEVGNPDFTPNLTKKLVEFCKNNNIKMLSYWNIGRDIKIEQNSGINKKYEHLAEMFKFL